MRLSITIFAFLAHAGLISAQCQQTAKSGNAAAGFQNVFTPSTTSPVTAGLSTNIKWQLGSSPESGNVALVLCKGPAINCVDQRCISESTPNQALQFSWNVPSDLEVTGSSGGYGIKIINIPSGDYQYSPQFGVQAGSSSSSAPVSSASSAGPVNSATPISSANPVSQITDGQIQAPTNIPTPTLSPPKYTPSGLLSTGPYYVPAPTGKVSNTTHSSGFKFSYGPNTAPAGALINSTQFLSVTPGVNAAPTGVLPVTSVAIASATPNGPLNPSVAPSATGVVTSPSNAAGKVVVGGLVAGLGAVAAFVL